MSRTKGAKNRKPRKDSPNYSAERMAALTAIRALGEPAATVRVLKRTKDALYAKVPKMKRIRFVSAAIDAKLAEITD